MNGLIPSTRRTNEPRFAAQKRFDAKKSALLGFAM
jgi:hypothetical protein